MSDKTGIAWTNSTWNPITGCTKVSQGCKNCYAERDWARLAANPKAVDYFGRNFTDVQTHIHRLDQPIRWRRPRRIFVNSMSDLFHEQVSWAFIDRVLAVMTLTPRHTYQVLTKRPERMRDYLCAPDLYERVLDAANAVRRAFPALHLDTIPVDNPASGFARHIWWGVSVEDQEAAEARIPILLQVPVAHHWLSAEPLLGPLRLDEVPVGMEGPLRPHNLPSDRLPRLDWVVVGGESGPRARPFDGEWVRTILADCHAAQVPVFVKQMGAAFQERYVPVPLAHRAGADPNEWPADLRVREYPGEPTFAVSNLANWPDIPAGTAEAVLANARMTIAIKAK